MHKKEEKKNKCTTITKKRNSTFNSTGTDALRGECSCRIEFPERVKERGIISRRPRCFIFRDKKRGEKKKKNI